MSNLDDFANAKDHLRDAIRKFRETSQLSEIELTDDDFIEDIKDIVFDETSIRLE